VLITLSVRHFSENSLKQTVSGHARGQNSGVQELQGFRSCRMEMPAIKNGAEV
jgi:hypothetical protein